MRSRFFRSSLSLWSLAAIPLSKLCELRPDPLWRKTTEVKMKTTPKTNHQSLALFSSPLREGKLAVTASRVSPATLRAVSTTGFRSSV